MDAVIGRVAWIGVCLIAIAAPFEARQPLARLPGQAISTVEAALLAVFALCAGGVIVSRRLPRWRTPLTTPWLAVLLVSLLAALAAPAHRANAMHMVGRFGLAFCVFVVAVTGTTTRSKQRGVLLAAAAGGVLVSVLAILEYLRVGFVLDALQMFRPAVFIVGAQVRAAGPFAYPTIASMYLEIVFAFALGMLLEATASRRVFAAAALVAMLALIGEAITLTFTRAGLLTLAVSVLLVVGLHYRRAGLDRGVAAIALVAVILAVEVLSSRSAEAIFLRLTTEGQEQWFRAAIDAPLDLAMQTGETAIVPIRVTNTGRTTWDPAAEHPVRFSYHWLGADEDKVVLWEGLRTLFASPVAPCETVTLQARVQAP